MTDATKGLKAIVSKQGSAVHRLMGDSGGSHHAEGCMKALWKSGITVYIMKISEISHLL